MSTSLGPGGRFGDYTIASMLGRGGMSVVYLAEDRRLGRQVAIKVLAEELAEDESFRTRFIRESQLAAGLEHPNIVPVYEAGELEGHLFIAMRYVRGTDLRTLISREGPLAPDRALALLRPIAAALDAAHRRGLVHRDVKPANILVAIDEGEEHPYLSDFGLTKHVSSKSGLTKTGQFMGTVDYVAPEQIRGEDVDGRTDEYSLACVLYQCLTGEVPFDKQADVATMFGHLQDPPPKVSARRPLVPAGLDDVVIRGMSKEREDRFPTCTAMMESLNTAVGLPSLPREQPSIDPSIVAMPPQPGTGPLLPAAPATPSGPSATPPSGTSTVRVPAAAPSPPRGTSRRALLIGGLAAVAVVAVVVLVVLSSGGEEPVPGPGPTGETAPGSAFANERPMDIPGAGITAPYPSSIEVADLSDTIDDVNVTIHGFAHAFPRDVDLVLEGPGGQTVFLMEGIGGPEGVSGLTITFDDAAPSLPSSRALSSGSFRPTTAAGDGFGFNGPPPAPEPPYGLDLSVFNGTDPNGTWNLFLFDDSQGSGGQIAGGWSLDIEVAGPTTTGATGSSGATGPSGEVIFTDDFSDPASGWDVFDEPRQHGGYQDGEYVLGVVGGLRVVGDFNTSTQEFATLGDVRVEATGRMLTPERDSVYGVVCRAATADDYYYFLIGGNGKYFIGENDATGATNFDVGVSPAVVRGRGPNRIVAECIDGPEGVILRMIVNGISVNTVVDAVEPIASGATGFRVDSGGSDAEAAFDDYVLSAPSSP